MTDQQFAQFIDKLGDICSMKEDVHTIRTDVELIKQAQETNRQANEKEHIAMLNRIEKVEVAETHHQSLIDRTTGGGSVANWVIKGMGLLITALLSGLGVYLLMR